MNKKWGSFVLWQGTILLCFCTLLAFIPALLFFFNLTITPWYFPIISGLTLIWAAYDGNKLFPDSRKMVYLGLLMTVVCVAVCLAISNWFFDVSYDGRYYHFFSIQLLRDGWNPVYDPKIAAPDFDQAWMAWARLYPKATWYFGAVLASFWGSSEVAKSSTLILMVALWLIVSGNLLKFSKLQVWQSILLGLVTALNPVQITQAFTKYVDGQISICLTIVFVALVTMWVTPDRLNRIVLGAALLYGGSIKASGLLYFAIFVFFGLIPLIVKNKNWREFWIITGIAAISVLFSLFILGYNPYVTNTILYHNPIHPLTLQNQNVIMDANRPKDFNDMDRFKRFAKSVLAPSSDPYMEHKSPSPKIPFTVTEQELAIFTGPDVRVGGFGPWFSGVLLLSGIGWLLLLRFKPTIAGMVFLGAVPILISIFSSAEGWWARYAPQTWLLPLLVLFGLWYASSPVILKRFALVLVMAIIVNIGMVSATNLKSNFLETYTARQAFEKIATNHQMVLMQCPDYCEATNVILRENQVAYQRVQTLEQLPCPHVLLGVYISPQVCEP